MEKMTSIRIYSLLIAILFSPACVFAEHASSNISSYEKEYLEAEATIKSLLNKKVIIFGMILGTDEVSMNLKVLDFSKLSEFMKALEEHNDFFEPRLIAHSEFHLPGFVLIRVKLRNNNSSAK